MIYPIIIIYAFLFAILAWKNFETALIIFLISLPSYLIRFNLFGVTSLPSTILELSFGIVFAVWVAHHFRDDWKIIVNFAKKHRLFTISVGLFLISSIISIFISDMWLFSLGKWRAFFLEPLLFLIILIGRRISFEKISFGLTLSTLSVSIVALLQKISPIFYPPSLWDDQLFGRVTSFFTSPNDVGLYLAPLIPFAIYSAITCHPRECGNPGYSQKIISWIAVFLALLAIFFSQSLGAYIALFLGLLIFLWLSTYKKSALVILVLASCLVFTPPVQTLIHSKNTSSNNRLILWNYSWTFLSQSPKNFIFGTGIEQFFRKIQKPYYDQKKMERLIYPHNIFLNFWTETGLLGLLSFIFFYSATLWQANSISKTLPRAALITALIILFVHGLVDVPFFKNDLAFLFWIIVVLAYVPQTNKA